MREIALSAGKSAQVAVEEDADGARVLLRIGNGRFHPIRALSAEQLAAALTQAAIEVREANAARHLRGEQ